MLTRKLKYFHFLLSVYGLGRGTTTSCWSGPAVIDLSELAEANAAGCYPLDFSRDDHPGLLVDEAGVPMIDYANMGKQYNPWFVGHIALGRYTRWRRHRLPDQLAPFRKLADWLVMTAVPCPVGVKWLYHFDWFGAPAPWFSGLSQAHAISVLLRAAQVFQEKQYADLARQATDLMIAPVAEQGTAWKHTDGTISLEEAPSSPPSSVLNGHLFSIFALREAACFFADQRYQQVLAEGIRFVAERIRLYDLGYWTRYSLQGLPWGLPDIASIHYHDVHIAQFRVLEAISGQPLFGQAADRFQTYQDSANAVRKALWVKRIAKLLR